MTEHEITVHAIVTVRVADWHEDPQRAARELIAGALEHVTRPDHDWNGLFAIVPEDSRTILATPDHSD